MRASGPRVMGRRASRTWLPVLVLGLLATGLLPSLRGVRVRAIGAPTSSVESPTLAASPGGTLTFTVGDEVRAIDVSRDGVTGDGIELREFPGHLRGHVGSEPVDLALAAPRISGQIGDLPVSLDMLPTKNGLRVAGRFGEREVALVAGPRAIDADVGPCRYRLILSGVAYVGQIACGAAPEDVRLEIPVSLVAKSDAEILAMLVAILAR
jgi:hypothetical protein